MFLAREWSMFYTVTKRQERNWDLVNQISIDEKNKRYVLDIDAPDLVTDGYDEEGEEIYSYPVSRLVFDIILNGLKEKGFKELIMKNN